MASADAAHPPPPADIAGHFQPPAEYDAQVGGYHSLLVSSDGAPVRTEKQWRQRRAELRAEWQELLGPWPPLARSPQAEVLAVERVDQLTRTKLRIAAGVDGEPLSGYLLTPPGDGPFPAVLVVYYEPESGAGLGVPLRDFARQLALRGFVTLSIGPPGIPFQTAAGEKVNTKRPYYGPVGQPVRTQPLSALAYAAANCHTFLAQQPGVDPRRIGIMGHSFGGKWAMFASALYDQFACAVWSDPGIVFDERDRKDNAGGSVNYWDEWYLGHPLGKVARRESRYDFRGLPGPARPRTGSYRTLVDQGRDLVELHALMAPRPFLVSGGTADRAERWTALSQAIAVNKLLGQAHGVAMTNRPTHAPTAESNDQAYRFLEWCLQR